MKRFVIKNTPKWQRFASVEIIAKLKINVDNGKNKIEKLQNLYFKQMTL